MFWIILLICFGLANCNHIDQANQNGDELIFSQILFRHGDRNIRKTYKNDPYKDECHWPGGFGQLIKVGEQRAYNLGKFLRRRYSKFLRNDTIYSDREITVKSSDYNRTIYSAIFVLKGLFSPDGQQITVHPIPLSSDYFINADHACKRWIDAREFHLHSPGVQKIMYDNLELFKYVEKNAGEPVRTIEFIKDIYEALEIERHLNKTLPKWTEKIMIPGGAFERFSTYWLQLNTGTNQMKRLKSGFLLKQILDIFENKKLGLIPDQLMAIYSGHDMTISSLLNTLGLFWPHVPPYSSSLLFEMYKSKNHTTDDHYIQLYYKNSTAEYFPPMNIPGCGSKCTLTQLYDLYREVLPSNFDECETHSTE